LGKKGDEPDLYAEGERTRGQLERGGVLIRTWKKKFNARAEKRREKEGKLGFGRKDLFPWNLKKPLGGGRIFRNYQGGFEPCHGYSNFSATEEEEGDEVLFGKRGNGGRGMGALVTGAARNFAGPGARKKKGRWGEGDEREAEMGKTLGAADGSLLGQWKREEGGRIGLTMREGETRGLGEERGRDLDVEKRVWRIMIRKRGIDKKDLAFRV